MGVYYYVINPEVNCVKKNTNVGLNYIVDRITFPLLYLPKELDMSLFKPKGQLDSCLKLLSII